MLLPLLPKGIFDGVKDTIFLKSSFHPSKTMRWKKSLVKNDASVADGFLASIESDSWKVISHMNLCKVHMGKFNWKAMGG